MENKNGCLICGKDIVYLQSPVNGKCVYCNKEFEINECCIDGHFICNSCHSSDAMNIIEEYCLHTNLINPIEIALTLMKHPSIKMHGPEHHFLVPAVILKCYYNVTNQENLLNDKIKKARKRAELIPGGFCGSHGNCGAGVGTGIAISIITGSTPTSKNEWQLSNLMTSKSLLAIALAGGPRCCKRDVYLGILEAIAFIKEKFNVTIPLTENIRCEFSFLNKECLHNNCKFYFSDKTI